MKELFIRSITGAVFVVLMLLAIWWNMISLTVLMGIVMTLALSELFQLRNFFPQKPDIRISFIISGIILLIASSLFASKQLSLPLYSLTFIPLLLLSSYIFFKTRRDSEENVYTIFLAVLYIIVPLCLVPFLTIHAPTFKYDPLLIISVLIIIWVYDSFAYLTGISIGKHKMFPSISPKKSWEGFIGGAVFALLAAYIISGLYTALSLIQWLILSMIVVCTGTAGDFFESQLKRTAGVKDTGNWLPGHGGILDRFDSFLFVIPFVYIYVKLFTTLL